MRTKSKINKSHISTGSFRRIEASRRGFSLLEVLMAMFIFVIVAMIVSAVFGKTILAYKSTKTVQKNLESSQFAMNQMAKILRQSEIDITTSNNDASNPKGTWVDIYDKSQNLCVSYLLDSGEKKLKYGYAAPVDPPGGLSGCSWNGVYENYSNMTSGYVTGNFSSVASSSSQAGKITVSMKVCADAGCASAASIQTTVSLRNK